MTFLSETRILRPTAAVRSHFLDPHITSWHSHALLLMRKEMYLPYRQHELSRGRVRKMLLFPQIVNIDARVLYVSSGVEVWKAGLLGKPVKTFFLFTGIQLRMSRLSPYKCAIQSKYVSSSVWIAWSRSYLLCAREYHTTTRRVEMRGHSPTQCPCRLFGDNSFNALISELNC